MSDVIDLTAAERRMGGAVESVKSNFATIRTGRANPSLLDRVEVEVYGSRMPLRSVANVGASGYRRARQAAKIEPAKDAGRLDTSAVSSRPRT